MTSQSKHSYLFIIESEGKPARAPPSALKNCACEQVDAQLATEALLRIRVSTQVRVKNILSNFVL